MSCIKGLQWSTKGFSDRIAQVHQCGRETMERREMQLAMLTDRKRTAVSHRGMELANYFANTSGSTLRCRGCLSIWKQNCEYRDWRMEQLGLVHLKGSLPNSIQGGWKDKNTARPVVVVSASATARPSIFAGASALALASQIYVWHLWWPVDLHPSVLRQFSLQPEIWDYHQPDRWVWVVSMMSCLLSSLWNRDEIYGNKYFRLFLFGFLRRRISLGERLFCRRLCCMIYPWFQYIGSISPFGVIGWNWYLHLIALRILV